MTSKRMKELLTDIEYSGPGDLPVTGIARDSRRIKSGQAFVAIPGYHIDGHRFIEDAISRGAAAVVAERDPETGEDTVPLFLVESTRRALSRMAASWYEFPAQEFPIIGITGTNGKTSVVYLLHSIFAGACLQGGSIGTLGYAIADRNYPTPLTTPDALELHSILRVMADQQVEMVAMEVSSHALALDRTADIQFGTAIFTNLGRDHFDFHRSREAYRAAKGKLFEGLSRDATAILNFDSPERSWFAARTPAPLLTYSVENAEADIYWTSVEQTLQGSTGTLRTPGGDIDISTGLLGYFNLSNIAAAAAAARANGISSTAISRGVERCSTIPGRLERISSGIGKPYVFVDYAHTPDALQAVLDELHSLRAHTPDAGNIWVVFGCGGDRDREKRPEMGAIAESLADRVVITSDNPRTEDPESIIDEILTGMAGEPESCLPDRREAISWTIDRAGSNDIVLIAGKGHEDYQEIAGERIHLDDREEVRKALEGGGAS